jgi:FixJ family two-component response regulator
MDMCAQQKTVCIVDDDPDIRMALERLLTLKGYRARSYASVTEFRAGTKSQEVDCLILDIHLNGESGIDLKRQLSQGLSALPVIFITGCDTDANRRAVQQVGAAGYLPKPFRSKALIEAIETATRSRS